MRSSAGYWHYDSEMPRSAGIVAVGFPHHITQRGNGRRAVFFSERDYEVYLRLLAQYARQYRLRIWGYCLMPNHAHIIGAPKHRESLWRTLGQTHGDYARYQNIQQLSCGHFWQARFYSCPMDHVHQWGALA